MFNDNLKEHEHHRLGNNHYRLGQFREAIDQYTCAIQLNAKMSESWFNRALANARLGEYEPAIRDASEVITLNPNSPDGYYLRGRVYELLLDDVAAVADFEHTIKIAREHEGAYNHLQQVRERRWMYEELREYRDRLASDGENGWLSFQYGRKLAEIGHQDDAVRALEYARSQGFSTPELWRELGEAYVTQNAPVQAMTAFRQAIRGNPTDVIPYAHLGQLLNEAGRFRDAADIFEQALNMPHDDEASLQCGLGTAYAGISRFDEARAAFNRALELRPLMAEPLLGLGMVAWLAHDLSTASMYGKLALNRDPTLVQALVLSVNVEIEQDHLHNAAKLAIAAFKHNLANPQLGYVLWALAAYSQKHYQFHASEIWRKNGNLVDRARYLVQDHVVTRLTLGAVRRGVSPHLVEHCPIADGAAELLFTRLSVARDDLLTVFYRELARSDLIPLVDRLRRAAKYAERLARVNIANLCDSYAIMLSSSPEVPRMEVVHRTLEYLSVRNIRHADVLHELYQAVSSGLSTESIDDVVCLRTRFERLALATAREGFVLPKLTAFIVDIIGWLDRAERMFSLVTDNTTDTWGSARLLDDVMDIRMRLTHVANPPEEWALAALLTHFGTLTRHRESSVRK